jgi:hypothetical protein
MTLNDLKKYFNFEPMYLNSCSTAELILYWEFIQEKNLLNEELNEFDINNP